MKLKFKEKMVRIAVYIGIALLSVAVISPLLSNIRTHESTIQKLDEKKTTVLELTAASTATSAAITLLPNDVATPIAEKLTDLSAGFLVVICAIYLEKYLLTIVGFVGFTLLVPIACILWSVDLFKPKEWLRNLASKLTVLAIAMNLVVPGSVFLSNMIENTYQESISATLNNAKETSKEVEENEQKEEGNTINSFFDSINGGINYVTQDIPAKVVNVLNNFIEALAVMIVTSCIIPLLVLLLMVYIVKNMFNLDLRVPDKMRLIPLPKHREVEEA